MGNLNALKSALKAVGGKYAIENVVGARSTHSMALPPALPPWLSTSSAVRKQIALRREATLLADHNAEYAEAFGLTLLVVWAMVNHLANGRSQRQ